MSPVLCVCAHACLWHRYMQHGPMSGPRMAPHAFWINWYQI